MLKSTWRYESEAANTHQMAGMILEQSQDDGDAAWL